MQRTSFRGNSPARLPLKVDRQSKQKVFGEFVEELAA